MKKGAVVPRAPTEVDRRVGERIRILRQSKGLSQTELGEACGVTFQQVQKYERGGNRVSSSRLLQIAGVLDVEAAYLLDGSGGKRKPADTVIEQMLAQYQGHKLAVAFMSIADREAQRDIVLFIEQYARTLARKARR